MRELLRALLAKATIQGVVTLMLAVTACYLAFDDRMTVELFIGLVIASFAWLFPRRENERA